MKKAQVVCTKCGKEAPVDTEKSTLHWTAYKPIYPCGGKTELRIDGRKL